LVICFSCAACFACGHVILLVLLDCFLLGFGLRLASCCAAGFAFYAALLGAGFCLLLRFRWWLVVVFLLLDWLKALVIAGLLVIGAVFLLVLSWLS
jgi:hypothetical protein